MLEETDIYKIGRRPNIRWKTISRKFKNYQNKKNDKLKWKDVVEKAKTFKQ